MEEKGIRVATLPSGILRCAQNDDVKLTTTRTTATAKARAKTTAKAKARAKDEIQGSLHCGGKVRRLRSR
jgi:hypothetical protein